MTKTTWGGDWTEQKLDAFEKYVNAYLTIMNKHRNNRKLIYFDAFAGSGSRELEADDTDIVPLFEELGISKDEVAVYKGAAERIVSIAQRGFDYYYFIEKDVTSRNELENRLNAIEHENKSRMIFRDRDANEQIRDNGRCHEKR